MDVEVVDTAGLGPGSTQATEETGQRLMGIGGRTKFHLVRQSIGFAQGLTQTLYVVHHYV